jgi:hypothetical protein
MLGGYATEPSRRAVALSVAQVPLGADDPFAQANGALGRDSRVPSYLAPVDDIPVVLAGMVALEFRVMKSESAGRLWPTQSERWGRTRA